MIWRGWHLKGSGLRQATGRLDSCILVGDGGYWVETSLLSVGVVLHVVLHFLCLSCGVWAAGCDLACYWCWWMLLFPPRFPWQPPTCSGYTHKVAVVFLNTLSYITKTLFWYSPPLPYWVILFKKTLGILTCRFLLIMDWKMCWILSEWNSGSYQGFRDATSKLGPTMQTPARWFNTHTKKRTKRKKSNKCRECNKESPTCKEEMQNSECKLTSMYHGGKMGENHRERDTIKCHRGGKEKWDREKVRSEHRWRL